MKYKSNDHLYKSKEEGYLIRSNGKTYSAIEREANERCFEFGKDDTIHVTYDPHRSELIFMKVKVF